MNIVNKTDNSAKYKINKDFVYFNKQVDLDWELWTVACDLNDNIIDEFVNIVHDFITKNQPANILFETNYKPKEVYAELVRRFKSKRIKYRLVAKASAGLARVAFIKSDQNISDIKSYFLADRNIDF